MTGAPVLLEQSVGFIEAGVINSLDVETHTLFIGRVVNAGVFSDEESMT
jgi:ferric-chelate reductase [NAD(P)H]